MGLRRLPDPPGYEIGQMACSHPDHNPPTMIVLPDGLYEYECPACAHKVTFVVRRPTC